jgi:tetratricopeptide (TPR) repeat protein
MPRTLAVVANPSHFEFMINDYRFDKGQFTVTFSEFTLAGDDVKSFLQTQSTFDVEKISDPGFQLISFLDPQGRVECYGWLVKDSGNWVFLVPVKLTSRSLNRLNKFLISEDVTISDPVTKEVTFFLGPNANARAPKGIMFDEECFLLSSPLSDAKMISSDDVERWRTLNGWPSFDGSDYSHEILNNLRLYDLSLVPNKGCYPGQETVSKIATRRGAAYSPVLIETNTPVPPGEVTSFEKKIGASFGSKEWQGKHYVSASLLRDFRVEKMLLHFSFEGTAYEGIVRYFPLLRGDREFKSRELFFEATEYFKHEDLLRAEEYFRLAIKVDPTFADAYESLGVMLGRLGRYQEAIELMQNLSSIDPKSVLAHTNMSLYLMKIGKITEAEEQKSLATVKSFQSYGDEAKRKEAEKLRKEKQREEWEQRESMFHQVLGIDPEDTLANYGLGSIAVEKGEWKKAREHLERVLKEDPKYSVAYLTLGKALKGLGLKEDARNTWKEGIKVAASKGDLMPANQMQEELQLL